MKRTRNSVLAVVLAGSATGLFAGACASSEDNAAAPPVDEHDASIQPVGEDAGSRVPDATVEAGPRTCSIHGFCHTTLPGDQKLKAVWGDGAGVVWAVSAEGNVLRWDGTAWKVQASNLGPLHAVWGSGATDVWIGGDSGLYHGVGGSSSSIVFAATTLPGDAVRITSIWGTAGNDVWAVGRTELEGADPLGEVLHFTTTDAGGDWAIDPISGQAVAYSHVWGTAGSGTWVAGSRPIEGEWSREVAVFRKTGGVFAEVELPRDPDWDPVFGRMGTLNAAFSAEAGNLLLLGHTVSGGPAFWKATSSDGEKSFTWTFAPDGTSDDPISNGAFGTAANDVWAVGDYGRVRHWDGSRWAPTAITATNIPVIDPLYAVWSRGTSEVWIVGDHTALRYDPTQKKDGGGL